jgi:hypothetical protein
MKVPLTITIANQPDQGLTIDKSRSRKFAIRRMKSAHLRCRQLSLVEARTHLKATPTSAHSVSPVVKPHRMFIVSVAGFVAVAVCAFIVFGTYDPKHPEDAIATSETINEVPRGSTK